MGVRHGWRWWGAVAAVSLGAVFLASCGGGAKVGVTTPKPPAASTGTTATGRVPAGDTVAVVTEDWQVGGRPTTRQVVVSAPATVKQLRDAANALRRPPHGAITCPMIPAGRPQQIVVAFATSSTAQPDVTFTVALTGCGRVTVAEHGNRVAVLANDAAFTAAYSPVLSQPPVGRHSPT